MKRPNETEASGHEPKKSKTSLDIGTFLTDTFSHIGLNIMENLDHQSFLNCKLVSKSWLEFINAECQRSSIIIHKEINFHKKKCLVANKGSGLEKKVKKLNRKLTGLQKRTKNLKELRAVQIIAKTLLPVAAGYSYLLDILSKISLEDLTKIVVDKERVMLADETRGRLNDIQYCAAAEDNRDLFKMLAVFTGTFNPIEPISRKWAKRRAHWYRSASDSEYEPDPYYHLYEYDGIKGGETALHDHENGISIEMKKFILDHVDDPSPSDEEGYTPLYKAIRENDFEAFKLFATKLGISELMMRSDSASCVGEIGDEDMPMDYLVKYEMLDYILFLLNEKIMGPDDIVEDYCEHTLLHRLVWHNRPKLLEKLLENGFEFDPNISSRDYQETPLEMAELFERYKMINIISLFPNLQPPEFNPFHAVC